MQRYDTEIIAMVSIIFLSRLNQNSLELYIPELIVRKEFQNQGVGKR
ncbi:MAG: GNAT family N-acetyltransferase [Nitrosopumilus sp.]|nr:GNAT family N-acetyltransferase [Nitrosopumilus sp.]